MVKIKNPDWNYIKEQGSEIICSTCKITILHNPSDYDKEFIESMVTNHKLAHKLKEDRKNKIQDTNKWYDWNLYS